MTINFRDFRKSLDEKATGIVSDDGDNEEKSSRKKEKEFFKKHIGSDKKHPVAGDDQFVSKKGQTKSADTKNTETVKESVFDKHQLAIAKKTLKLSDAGANILGGMSKDEARAFLKKQGWNDKKIAKLEEALDPVNKKELKKSFKDRAKEGDGDIDNDGDEDESDRFLHRRRKAIAKAIAKESYDEEVCDLLDDVYESLSDENKEKFLDIADEDGGIDRLVNFVTNHG